MIQTLFGCYIILHSKSLSVVWSLLGILWIIHLNHKYHLKVFKEMYRFVICI